MNVSKIFRMAFAALIVGASTIVCYGQQVDYAKRELTASPAIRAKLTDLRGRIAKRKASFTVGYTTALDRDIASMTGFRPPENFPMRARGLRDQNLRALDAERLQRVDFEQRTGKKLVDAILAPSADSSFLDWRRLGITTRVQSQSPCGTCYIFGSLAAYESSYKKRNGTVPDLSEQQILNCSGAGSCVSGDHIAVFNYLVSKGTVLEAAEPYAPSQNSTCKFPGGGNFDAVAWNLVTWDALPGTKGWPRLPTVAELKQALVEHGPLAVAMWANGSFQAYTSGVLEELLPPGSVDPDGLTVQSNGSLMGPYQGDIIYASNHVVLLEGWDDSKGAWLIKNSWGPGWGETGGFGTERGYAWIKYNNLNVGLWGSWIVAESTAMKPNIVKPGLKLPTEVVRPKPLEKPQVKKP